MQTWWRLSVAGLVLTAVAAIGSAAAFRASPAFGRQSAEAPDQPPGAPTVVVEGQILFIDRESDRNHPAAGLKVEVWDQDKNFPAVGEKLDETLTDASGFFRSRPIVNVDPDGPAGRTDGTQDVYVRLFTNNGTIRLFQTGTSLEYDWRGYQLDPLNGVVFNIPNGTQRMQTLIIQENTPNVQALWTFVSLAEGWNYLKDKTGVGPGEITAYWSKNSADGPRYDPAGKALHFRSDNAGYEDVIIQHEAYALVHNALGSLPGAWSACTSGPAEGAKSAGDAACAFLQGFATFYPLAVTQDPVFDSFGLRGDFDAARAGTPGWADGDKVAARVAGALWDLHENDGSQDGDDKFNAQFVDIWAVIKDHQPATMAEWWAGWKAAGNNTCDAVGSLFQNTIDYNTKPQVAAIPDVVLDEDQTKAFNLHTYVTDAECGPDKLVFRMTDAGDRNAGVRIDVTGAVSITPAANWFGETLVRGEVSDGPTVAPLSFKVVVRSVNDCPVIQPRVSDPPVARYKESITLNLLPHAQDVEDQPVQLRWDAELAPQNLADIRVDGGGTTTLVFTMTRDTIERYSALVTLVVKDRDNCETRQPLVITWDSRPNKPPYILDQLRRDYRARQGETITVDLTGMALDDEDPPEALQWFIDSGIDHFSVEPSANKQVFKFTPDPADFLGSVPVMMRVADSGSLSARAAITLTWLLRREYENLPPQILRNKLVGRTAGLNAEICYNLLDKAEDLDDSQASLRWFLRDFDPVNLSVRGEGSRRLCLTPRPNYEGCIPATFMVVDPWGLSDTYIVPTCWRTIAIHLPYMVQRSEIRRLRSAPR